MSSRAGGAASCRLRDPLRKPLDADAVAATAFELFSRQGYNATSLDQVASALGISKAAIYYHHAGKEAILQHGLDAAMGALESMLQEAVFQSTANPPLDRFAYLVRRASQIGLDHKATVEVLLRLKGNSELERSLLERRRAFDAAAAAILREAVTTGDLQAGSNPTVLASLSIGVINTLVEWYRPDRGIPAGELAEVVVRFVMGGLPRTGTERI